MTTHTIRRATESDSAEIARLAGQLGYPVSDKAMRLRLQRLLANPDDVIFVADTGEGHLLGWIHGVCSQYVESECRVEIGGLVVEEKFHRKGIGRALVAHLERWALERGLTQTVVRCRTTRPEAHLFYESLGYGKTKTQVVFRKSLLR